MRGVGGTGSAVGLVVALAVCMAFFAGRAQAATFDLADILGGGNGLGTGGARGIEAHNGNIVTSQGGGLQNPANPGDYYPVPSYPMVDGVFVPNGTIGPQQITSTGITFDFAGQATALGSYNDFFNAKTPGQLGMQNPSNAAGLPDFFSPGHSIIGSHAQKAITFDLDAIRAEHGMLVRWFTAIIGDSRPKAGGSVSYYVLIDGVDMAHGFGMTNTEDHVEVEIPDHARFLTLVMANAGDNNGSDHGYFGDPRLSVPEPATMALLAMAVCGVGGYLRRWRRA